MGSFLRYLLLALLIVLVGAWIFTVSKSCNAPKTDPAGTNTTEYTDPATTTGTETGEADLEDLYEVEESDVESGNADDSENLPDYANAADDLEMGNAGDPDEDAINEEDPEPAEDYSTSETGSSTGSITNKYLVVAGSYLSEANAKIMANQLDRMGFSDAEVTAFDLSQYYSVIAGRYRYLGEARSAARTLNDKGVEAYVHKMRGKRVSN